MFSWGRPGTRSSRSLWLWWGFWILLCLKQLWVFEQEADDVPFNILTMMGLAAAKKMDRKKQRWKQEADSNALQRCRGHDGTLPWDRSCGGSEQLASSEDRADQVCRQPRCEARERSSRWPPCLGWTPERAPFTILSNLLVCIVESPQWEGDGEFAL